MFGLCTLAAVVIATGFGYHDPSDVKLDERWAREAAGPEDDDEERTSISLGWLVHAALSIKARIVRLVTRRSTLHAPAAAARRAPTPAVSPRDRVRAARRPKPPRKTDEIEEIEDEPKACRSRRRARKPAATEAGQALERRLSAARA